MKQTLVISGASSGLGRHWLELLLRGGHKLVAISRNTKSLTPLTKLYAKSLFLFKGNITDLRVIKLFINFLKRFKLKPDVLINNAGYGLVGPVEILPPAEIIKQFQINLFALINLTQHILPLLKNSNHPKIINIGSTAGVIASPLNGIYAATKHGLEALTDALRIELIPQGIQVSCLQFGRIETPYTGKTAKQFEILLKAKGIQNYSSHIKAALQDLSDNRGKKLVTLDKKLLSIINKIKLASRYSFDNYSRMIMLLRRYLPRWLFDSLIRWKSGFRK